MLLLIPLGADSDEPRLPRATIAIILFNALIFLYTAQKATPQRVEEDARLERVADWTIQKAGDERPALRSARARYPTALEFLATETAWHEWVPVGEERERLEQCLLDSSAIRTQNPFYRYGLIPGHLRAVTFLTHMFLHADAFHLLFNLIFLWAVGGFLEATWGVGVFALLYTMAGIAAALAHTWLNPHSTEPAIGASGAIAGLMGTFLVAHFRQRIRVALVAMLAVAPRISFHAVPAFVFLIFWFAEQVFWALMTAHQHVEIAFGAHIGGFLFGAACGAPLLAGLVSPVVKGEG